MNRMWHLCHICKWLDILVFSLRKRETNYLNCQLSKFNSSVIKIAWWVWSCIMDLYVIHSKVLYEIHSTQKKNLHTYTHSYFTFPKRAFRIKDRGVCLLVEGRGSYSIFETSCGICTCANSVLLRILLPCILCK